MRSRTRPTAHAGVVLAVVVGALPAATVGLDVAWVVVASGLSALALAPFAARRQVRAVQRFDAPKRVVAHVGRTTPIQVEIGVRRTARHLLLDVTRDDAPPAERERAPRLAITAIRGANGAPLAVSASIRPGRRGRSSRVAATFESSFPFSLFRSERRIVAASELIAVPRVLRRADGALRTWLTRVASGDDAVAARHAPRSAGLPVAFRPTRVDDTARDIAWRASARHMRWIAVDRTPLARERVTIEIVSAVRGARATSARRSTAAFEAAVTLCATAIDRLTRAGHVVTLRVSRADADEPIDAIARARSEVAAKSARALPHLIALADVVQAPPQDDPGGTADARPGRNTPRGASRGERLLVLACARPFTEDGTRGPAGCTVLLVDSSGRGTLVDGRRGTSVRGMGRREASPSPPR
ncbi:MAG: DUF58 domain-containing protein [Planctomycetota bacterium]